MKRYNLFGFGFLAAVLLAGCEPKDEFDESGSNLTPVSPQEVVHVPADDGVTRVNGLVNAIAEHGDAIYELERDGVYYLEGKTVLKNNVVIRAANGTGELPMIQPISDAQGALNSDMLRFEGNVTFENIYFNGKDAASNNIMQRLFRLDGANIRLRFNGCFVENCRNFCIRTDATNTKIYIENSTFRNLALTSDPANGRLIDTRGNSQDTISVTNSTIYNMTGHLLRFDGSITNYLEFRHNTVYNVGYHVRLDYAMKAYIEDNIFANVGWKAGYDASTTPAFWDFKSFKGDATHPKEDMKIYIRNNNVFTSPEISALYVQYPANIERKGLNSTGMSMVEDGRLIFENNISEILTFDNPSPLPMLYISKFFEVLGNGMSAYSDLPFYVDENGIDGFTNSYTYTFIYPTSALSATSSTTGGALGSRQWMPIP